MTGSAPNARWRARRGWRVRRFGRWCADHVRYLAPAVLVVAVVGTLGAPIAGGSYLRSATTFLQANLGPIAVGSILVFSVVTVVRRSRQGRSVRALAAREGWDYVASDPTVLGRLRGWPFDLRGTRRAADVVRGSIGERSFCLFDYRWSTEKNRKTDDQSIGVAAIQLPSPLQPLRVDPESALGAVAPGLVTTDVDLEDGEFNRRFRVRVADAATSSRKYAVDVLTPRTVEAMLGTEPFSWRIEGNQLIGWWPSTSDAELMLTRARVLVRVVEGIPSFVWADRLGKVR